jgi:hypothetical protein
MRNPPRDRCRFAWSAPVNAEKERAHLADPKNLATFAAQRKTNRMDEKFCWKS